MPIRPERKGLYPGKPEWTALRERVLVRAGHRCEGSPRFPGCRAANYEPHPSTGSAVVLTIAHMDHDPTNNEEGNLRALCQRCHLNHDAHEHQRNRRLKVFSRPMPGTHPTLPLEDA